MTVVELIDVGWPREFDIDILPGLPPGGPAPLQFPASASPRGREGLVVRVSQAESTWDGNFQFGDGTLTAVYVTPSPHHLCVVARGCGYWVSANDPGVYEVIDAYPVKEVRPLRDIGLLLFVDYTDIEAYSAGGRTWASGRVSWDGITIMQADERGVLGRAWDAVAEKEVGFFIDPRSGRLEGGSAPPNSD